MSTSSQFFAGIWLSVWLFAGCGRTHSGGKDEPKGAPASAPSAKPSSNVPSAPRPDAVSSSGLATDVHFAGQVSRGEPFERKVAGNLLFRLNPYAAGDSGWRIEILPDTIPLPKDFDCSGSVTPPGHGPNPIFLDRPDGMTPEKSALWKPHEFNFVADPSKCKTAWDLSVIEEYPSKLSDKEKEAAEEGWGDIFTGVGTLRVSDSRLGPPSVTNEYGPILWLRFEVTLQYPSRATTQH